MMTQRLLAKILPLALCGVLAFPRCSAWADTRSTPVEDPSPASRLESLPAPAPVSPGLIDGQIAYVAALILQRHHYTKQPFDDTVSSKFLDRYIEAYDPQHLHFTQDDLAEFERYRTNLGRLTLNLRHAADTRPAFEIFNRFIERLQQRVAYSDELLQNEEFKFDTDERITINRHEMPYPKDLNEARQLWRERLRYDYLQEKLGKEDARKKRAAAHTTENQPSAETKADSKPKTDAEDIVDTLKHRYHRNVHTFAEWNHDDVLQVYLTTLARVYDPHSDYMGHAQLDSFAITMNLSLFGIGAELGTEDGYCVIRRLLPGGPAEKSKKIAVNDRIVAVAQSNQPPTDIVEMNLNKAVQLIRGPKGTEVRLTIIPAGENASTRNVIPMIRDEIKLEDQAAKSKLIEWPDSNGGNVRLGVIDLASFYATFDASNSKDKPEPKSTTADVARLLTKLKQEHVDGVILDLRRNGGGSLEEAIHLTGLFIKQGPVVQVRDSEGAIEEDDDNDPSVLYDGPLIVLTSRFTASASEILAGALQDYGRAIIVGDRSTHGKGTVQSVNKLGMYLNLTGDWATNDPGALKLTIKKFYRASGASTQLQGVTPDIILPSVANESKDIGESALENPLAADAIKSAKYEHLNLVEPYLGELRQHSEQRVASEREFDYVREDIDLFRKQQADKTISLNAQVRLKEKEEADARDKARKKERLTRKVPPEKAYEITLKQAVLPGLPPPIEKTNNVAAGSSPRALPAMGGASTNSASVTPKALRAGEVAGDEEEDVKAADIDATLVEAEHILVDYLGVLHKQGLTANHRVTE
jgi:carboxyl-terminal processing protease